MVGGSSPSGRISQFEERQALTDAKTTSQVGKPEKFTESLRGSAGIDPDLATLIDRWPTLSKELRAAISRMIG